MLRETVVHTPDMEHDIDKLICCLEFLAQQALSASNIEIHTIIKRAISDVERSSSPYQKNNVPFDYTDILTAFQFFTKFCLIEDPEAKKQIIRMMQKMEKDALKMYIN
jgi:hypothetical protein